MKKWHTFIGFRVGLTNREEGKRGKKRKRKKNSLPSSREKSRGKAGVEGQ